MKFIFQQKFLGMFHFTDVIRLTNISSEFPFLEDFMPISRLSVIKHIHQKWFGLQFQDIVEQNIFCFFIGSIDKYCSRWKKNIERNSKAMSLSQTQYSMNIIIPRQNRNKHCNYAYARNLIHAYANVFVQIKAESACAISWTNPEKSNNNNDGRSNDSDRSSSSSSITNAEMTQTHLFA